MEGLVSGLERFRGERVLVTGDTGFKGAWLSLWLSELGARVTGYALPPESDEGLFVRAGLGRRVRHVDGDVRDAERLAALVAEERPAYVFHLAAQSLVRRSYADPRETFETNVSGSVNLLEAVRREPAVRALVYVTSDKCYRNKEWVWGYRETDELGGSDPYSASKAAAEIVFSAYHESYFARRAGFGAASVRAGNVIGGGDWCENRIVPDVVRALRAGEPVVLRNPRSTRPWQHVLDPLHGYLRLALALVDDPAAHAGAWNFGPDGGAAHTVDEVARLAVEAWGGGEIEHRPDPGAPREATLLQVSVDKARARLGFRARYDVATAVRETMRWYREVHRGADALELSCRQLAEYARAG
ncbi:MAG TPA: CDP-glucose 4,6-dehydratase [Polyangiaceae bacterium]|nr:CDP-glucose 4,6-dehydratase [Polyangiaceae bacterium]